MSHRRMPAKGTMSAAEMFYPDVAMPASDDDQRRVEQSYLRYAGSGLEFCATVAILTLFGVWLDGRLGTSPLFVIALAFVGFAAATWNLVRSVFPSDGPDHHRDEQP